MQTVKLSILTLNAELRDVRDTQFSSWTETTEEWKVKAESRRQTGNKRPGVPEGTRQDSSRILMCAFYYEGKEPRGSLPAP